MKLPSRLKFGTHTPGALPAWTESISRHLAVVRTRDSISSIDALQKNDEIALEIDLPERHPFSRRCILCVGRVGFVSHILGDRMRLGVIVDRMQFGAARNSQAGQLASIACRRLARNAGSVA
jgi:hypothetical protein